MTTASNTPKTEALIDSGDITSSKVASAMRKLEVENAEMLSEMEEASAYLRRIAANLAFADRSAIETQAGCFDAFVERAKR